MSVFQFQQFSVIQKTSGMKICTDTLIFGSMIPIQKGDTVLDIGTGTGILALMSTQKGAGSVDAVEITKEAFEEAQLNFLNSPWTNRLKAVYSDIQNFVKTQDIKYDLIISNPPFFNDFKQIDDLLRKTARCNNHLTFTDIVQIARNHLHPSGRLYVLIPSDLIEQCIQRSSCEGLYLKKKLGIQSYPGKKPHVYALTFEFNKADLVEESVSIHQAHNVYSSRSEELLKPFLLRFQRNSD